MKKKIAYTCLTVLLSETIATAVFLHSENATRASAAGHNVQIRVDNFAFSPDQLTIPVNSTVEWVNRDDVPHTVASTDGFFKSRALDSDEAYSHTFSKAGTYEYYCSIHPKMVGKIVVK